MVRKILLVVALIVATFLLTSCQTVSGLGRDITWSAETTADLLEGE